MAGPACVKKFRNCEAVAEMRAYEAQMEAFHWAQERNLVSADTNLKVAQIDAKVAKALRLAREEVLGIGLELA